MNIKEKQVLFMNMIKKQEGGKLHRNKSEKDITTGYGIYKYSFPEAEIFKYIDSLAKSLNINKKSSEWSKSEIETINKNIDTNKELQYTIDFYNNEYFKKIDIYKLPIQLTLSVGSILINSPKIASKALQISYNTMIKLIDSLSNEKQIDEDGIIGSGTRNAIYKLSEKVESSDTDKYLWFYIFINSVISQYVDMATDNGKEDKQLQYLRGWVLNRCDYLIKNITYLVK